MKYDPESPHYAWRRNVVDEFQGLSNDEIVRRLAERSNGFAVLMSHVAGDFNIGSVMRSANFFGAAEFFYFGKKRFDRRAAVGVHNYTPVSFLETRGEVSALAERYTLVALENNVEGTVPLFRFGWQTPKPPCIVVGEESRGLDADILSLCSATVEIPNFGSVRSVNVSTAAAVAMADFVAKVRADNLEKRVR